MIIRAGWSNATLGGILAIVTHDLNKLNPLDSQTEGELTGIWHSSLTLQQNKHVTEAVEKRSASLHVSFY